MPVSKLKYQGPAYTKGLLTHEVGLIDPKNMKVAEVRDLIKRYPSLGRLWTDGDEKEE